jgi:hypothetical protein
LHLTIKLPNGFIPLLLSKWRGGGGRGEGEGGEGSGGEERGEERRGTNSRKQARTPCWHIFPKTICMSRNNRGWAKFGSMVYSVATI